MTSGATYCGVPQMVFMAASCAFLASPKSAIFSLLMSFSIVSSRFSSLRSRCTTPLEQMNDQNRVRQQPTAALRPKGTLNCRVMFRSPD